MGRIVGGISADLGRALGGGEGRVGPGGSLGVPRPVLPTFTYGGDTEGKMSRGHKLGGR